MAILGKVASVLKQEQRSLPVKIEEVHLSVKDTDFLLKLIMSSSFQGTELEQGYLVTKKLAEIHRRNIED
jgi:hypothetical protein